MIICECGCGNQYLEYQCIKHKHGIHTEVLFAPHAVDVWGLFCDPVDLEKQLLRRKIFGLHLPGTRVANFLTRNPDYISLLNYQPRNSIYGIYYISCQHLISLSTA